jgi:hypothetical protein
LRNTLEELLRTWLEHIENKEKPPNLSEKMEVSKVKILDWNGQGFAYSVKNLEKIFSVKTIY